MTFHKSGFSFHCLLYDPVQRGLRVVLVIPNGQFPRMLYVQISSHTYQHDARPDRLSAGLIVYLVCE
jgi:hypothetical protein